MVKDKGKGERTKPYSEAMGATKIQNDTVKVREAEAKDISPLRPDKKEVVLPSAKIQSRRRSHQIFGVTKFGFHSALCVTHVRIWTSHCRYHPYLLDCCQSKIVDLVSLLLLLSHHRYHPYLLNCYQSKIVDLASLLLLLSHCRQRPYLLDCCQNKIVDLLFLWTTFYSQLVKQACLNPFMYTVLLLYLIKR